MDPKSEIFDEEMIRLLISKLENSNHRIIVASLRIIGNLSANVENFHRVLVSNGFVQTLVFLMSHQRSGIRKEIYWIVSNLVSESSVMIEQLLEADVYRRVYQVLKEEKDKLAKKEAVWIVANTASTCTLDQARKLAEIGLISELIVVLEQTPELFNLISDGILHYLNQDRELLSRENRQRLRSLIIAPRNDEADLIIIQKLSDLLNDYNDIEANN